MAGLVFVVAAVASVMPACRKLDEGAPRLTVFVATSLAEVIETFADEFTASSGIRVAVNPAATGVLRKQVEQGAACDVFIAADAVDLDKLAEQGLIRADTRREVARNRLVVVGCDVQTPFADLGALRDATTGRVAMGDPAYVPAGRYAQRALEAAGVWTAVQPRAVFADNVRVASEYVRSGQAKLGFVYATDAALMDDCRVLLEIDEALSGTIACPAAICAKSKQPAVAATFLAYLVHSNHEAAWAQHGFVTPVVSTSDDH